MWEEDMMINLLKKQIEVLKKLIKAVTALLKLKKKKPTKPLKDYNAFCMAIGERESGNNYLAVNTLGYLGKYQFGMARLCDLGYTEFAHKKLRWKPPYSRKGFLDNADLQDKVFKKHVQDLVKRINRGFKSYLGTKVNGFDVTLSGCVAFAHIAGFGGLIRFLRYGTDPQDAYGTKASSYLAKFGNYNLEA